MRLVFLFLLLSSFLLSCENKNKQKGLEVYKDYHPNGQLFRTGAFDDVGKKEGKWLYYDEHGKLLQDENYKNGKEDGTWNWYDQNGEKLFPKE
jgi:antitoxin component YwqK of YwqJK toxin-antitoxin module